MTEAELAALVRETLYRVAPDIEGQEIDPGERFRDQFEIDSMDFLNFVIGLHKATGVQIPEADYAKLATLSDCIAYLEARLSAG